METSVKFLINYFGIDANTAATIVITIFVFAIGVVTQQLIEYSKAKSRRKLHREILLLNIDSLESDLISQANSFKSFMQQIQFSHNRELGFGLSDFVEVETLTSIGYENTFQGFFYGIENFSFAQSKKLNAFMKLWSIILSIKKAQEQAAEFLGRYTIAYESQNTARNEACTCIINKSNVIIQPLRIGKVDNLDEANFANSVDHILTEWGKDLERVNPQVTHEKLIVKLHVLSKQYQHLQQVLDLQPDLNAATVAYEELKILNETATEQYKMFSDFFDNKGKQIVEIRTTLRTGFFGSISLYWKKNSGVPKS